MAMPGVRSYYVGHDETKYPVEEEQQKYDDDDDDDEFEKKDPALGLARGIPIKALC